MVECHAPVTEAFWLFSKTHCRKVYFHSTRSS